MDDGSCGDVHRYGRIVSRRGHICDAFDYIFCKGFGAY